MELRHLRYFVALAEELHFTRAARRLGISQPPLSQQIRALEDALATPLFERGRRGVALTDAGRMLLPEARAALAQAARAEAVARRAGRGELGELRIGLYPSAPLQPVFQRAILSFRRRFPDVHLTLQEGPTLWQLEALRRRQLDAAFLRCAEESGLPAEFVAVRLTRERLVVVMRQDHPLAATGRGALPLAALAGEPMVFFARSVGTLLHEQLAALCHAAGFEPNIAQEARENSTLMGLVAAGLGIAVVPDSLTQIRVGEVVRRPLRERAATTGMWLALPREPGSTLARRLMDCATGQQVR